ncbi:NnrS family protein [Marinobacter salicampi]|uniref:NnrS family protein n=1 Tax=Marinobacter salicampi TaxID=435907 RepID=UPI00140C6FB4|nr:NnrS family protein [Marinobacter salicampi]
MSKKARQPFASLYFFPVAAAYGALALPWSVLAQFGLVAGPPGLQGSLGHAHEMLFGFAMAVVAGYVLGPQPRRWIALTLGLWIASRISFLGWPTSFMAALANIAFASLLAYRVIPRFARSAKKWRNKAVAPVILGLCIAAALFMGLYQAAMPGPLYGVLLEAILLLSTLMFFMGGRILAPAVAGHMLKQNRELEARVQPRLEGTVLILMASVLVLNVLLWPPLRMLIGVLLILAAGTALARLLRWPLKHCLDRPDLLALMLGYLWLIIGWLLIALALMADILPASTAIHGLTVGALGTLTLTVMARTRAQRVRKDTSLPALMYVAVGLISIAALARLAAGTVAPGLTFHLLAAGSWSLGFFILLGFLVHLKRA